MPLPLLIPAFAEAEKLPVVGGVFGKVTSVFSGITSTFQHSDPGRDQSRDAGTDAAYNKAIAGDVLAIAYLHARGGKMGTCNIPGYGQTGGWASDVAKNYAESKYRAIAAMPALADKVAQADAILRGAPAPAATVTDALYAPVAGTGIPTWMLLVVLLAVGAVVWFIFRRH